jgi:hypothetical protein
LIRDRIVSRSDARGGRFLRKIAWGERDVITRVALITDFTDGYKNSGDRPCEDSNLMTSGLRNTITLVM